MSRRKHKLFHRTWGYNYIPVSAEGFGCSILFILMWSIPFFALLFLIENEGHWLPITVCVGVLVFTFTLFLRFAHRHS